MNRTIYVNRTLVYIKSDDENSPNFGKWGFEFHEPRCIERGMNPKTLQIILGHSTIQLTMNLYCHVTDDMLISEMSKFESGVNETPEGVIPINGVKVV